jgi:hypothetical protein
MARTFVPGVGWTVTEEPDGPVHWDPASQTLRTIDDAPVPGAPGGPVVDAEARASASVAKGMASAVSGALASHASATDPHPGYITAAELATALSGLSGGSSLPTAIAPVTAIPLDGNKAFNADTISSGTPLTIAAGQVEGGSCTLVIKGNGSAWGGITGALKAGGSAAFVATLNTVNHVLVWVEGGRVRYTVSQSDPAEVVVTPVAPTNTVPTIVTAVAGSALVWTGGSAAGSPTPTTVYAWLTSADVLVQDNITSGSYTPPAAGSFKLRMTSSNGVGSPDVDVVAVTVTAAATAPGAPTGLASASVTLSGFTASFTAPASNGGATIDDYKLQTSADSGSTWNDFVDATSTALSIAVTGLTAGTAYQWRVAAHNSVGWGAWSAAASVTTSAAPPLVSGGLVRALNRGTATESSAPPYTYTAVSAGMELSGWQVGGSGSYAPGNERVMAFVTLANPTLAGATTTSALRTQSSIGGTQEVGVQSSGGTYKYAVTAASVNVFVADLPADTGQADTLVRGADWTAFAAPASWPVATNPATQQYATKMSSGALRFYISKNGSWHEVAVYRPTAGIGAGLTNDGYNSLARIGSGGAAGDTISLDRSAT